MRTLSQILKEALQKHSYRTSREGRQTIFGDRSNVDNVEVGVSYKRKGRRAYDVSFDVEGNYLSKTPRAKSEKVASKAPAVLKRVRDSIEGFADKKRPNQLHLQPNEPHKAPIYRTFAHHLAKKHGGRVEEVQNETGTYKGMPKYVVHLPGKTTI